MGFFLSANAAIHSTEADVFDIQVFVDSIFGRFFAESALFEASEAGFRDGETAFVDAQHSEV